MSDRGLRNSSWLMARCVHLSLAIVLSNIKVSVRLGWVPPKFLSENTLGLVRGLAPIFPIHHPPESTFASKAI
ncbi:hypothetical protein TNCV_738171 [Trichonephila clavipes]|nr:hypothetical protein TNCV_738171 [Trichonephila clavipes]